MDGLRLDIICFYSRCEVQHSQHHKELAEGSVMSWTEKPQKGKIYNSAYAISATCCYRNTVVAADSIKSFIQTR